MLHAPFSINRILSRSPAILSVVLGLLHGCGGQPRSAVEQGPRVETPLPARDTAPPRSEPAVSSTRETSPWFKVRVDPDTDSVLFADLAPTSIFVRSGTPVLVAKPVRAPVTAFEVGDRETVPRTLGLAHLIASAQLWQLGEYEGLTAVRPDGVAEVIVNRSVPYTNGGLALDAAGNPHACVIQRSHGLNEPGDVLVVTREPGKSSPKKTRWTLETLADRYDECRIAIHDDTTTLLLGGNANVVVKTRVARGEWKTEELPHTPQDRIALASSSSGVVAIATATTTGFSLWKQTDTGWSPQRIAYAKPRTFRSLAIAVGNNGVRHVAWQENDLLRYTSDERTEPLDVADVGEAPSITVDEHDVVHLAYLEGSRDRLERSLVYARLRVSGDPAASSDGFAVRDDAMQACSDLIQAEHGGTIDDARRRRGTRWCVSWGKATFDMDALREKCLNASDANACVVASQFAGPQDDLRELHRAALACSDKPTARCDAGDGVIGPQYKWPHQSDPDGAYELREKACELGVDSECIQLAFWKKDARRLQDLCLRKRNLLACAAAADGSSMPGDVAAAARSVATASCKSDVAQGCNLLAYLEDKGLGGPRNAASAARHYLQACETDDSTLSCAAVLTAAKPLGPPAEFDGRSVALSLQNRCEANDEPSCAAFARMLELGWAIPRDAQSAASVRAQACEAGMSRFCVRKKN